ncbi:MAG: hypothetical protein BGO49_24485 [Planctomycetales bacterium 71-10]|nr:MAG: hypothetical protein BGO49_24485 [Planctomycetales bacterium 71-10]
MYHIYSTLANDNEYIRYSEHGPRGVNVAERSVLVKGGSGVHQKRLGTPLGVHTAVSDEDFAWLKENFSFKQHMANGYIRVEKSKLDPEVVAADMVTRDQKTDACPIVPQDFSDKPAKDGLTAIEPKTNKKSKAA